MFSVLLKSTDRAALNRIQEDQTTVFLSNGLILFNSSKEPSGSPIEFSAGTEEINATLKETEGPEVWSPISDFDSRRDRLTQASHLQFYCNEYLDPNLYFSLKRELNVERSRYNLTFVLKYKESVVYSPTELPMIDPEKKIPRGAMIVCSRDLRISGVPEEITTGLFRDLIKEIGIREAAVPEGSTSGKENCSCLLSAAPSAIDLSQLVSLSTSKGVYLFFQEPTLFSDDSLQEFITDIEGNIDTCLLLQLFPSDYTGPRLQELTRLSSGLRFALSFPVPREIPIYSESLSAYFILNSTDILSRIQNQNDIRVDFYPDGRASLVIVTQDLKRFLFIRELLLQNP